MQPLLASFISGKTDFIASLVSILDCNLLFQLVSAITVQRVRIVIPPNFPESVTEIIQVCINLRVVMKIHVLSPQVSLGWSTFEQVCLWQIIEAEILTNEPGALVPLCTFTLRIVSPTANHEACTIFL